MATNNLIQNPGLSIIALSLMMNFLVLPLYMRADAMQEHERDMEAKLRDGVKHIKKTFTGDERMMMMQAYYRQNDYRPTDVFKGSISLFLEIPFFISAYLFLSNCQIIQGVSFGPIADLGSPDGLIAIGGMSINLLPFIMTGFNLVSCALFTKGMPAKTKVQLYGMAAFFLVFLYTSPSGLVFYWTLNNVFALIKTLFYKLKNPRRMLMALFAIAGVAIIVFGVLSFARTSLLTTALLVFIGICCMVPFILFVIISLVHYPPPARAKRTKPTKHLFVSCALFLTALTGILIPSAVISASPQEFFAVQDFVHPLWLVASSTCLAAGTFLLWFGVFYWLCNDRAKIVFQTVMAIACGIAVLNYMLFGTDLGLISSSLKYDNGLTFTAGEMLVNFVAILVLAIVVGLFAYRFQKPTTHIAAIMAVVMCGMSVLNVTTIQSSVADASTAIEEGQKTKASFTLSKTGQNVVVIMIDRAIGPYIPFIMNEKPDLQDRFSGFTYYSNTMSYGEITLTGSAPLFGGYEYTPSEMNKRDDVLMKDKQNEALRVMPVNFEEAGYDVTVMDPPYANYNWIPDTTIYDDYPDINALNVEGYFSGSSAAIVKNNKRNFFCFSLMKCAPLFAQRTLYGNGTYNKSASTTEYETSTQKVSADLHTATGIDTAFYNSYSTLLNMSKMTEISQDSKGGFLMMTNNAVHDPTLLQEPNYELAQKVDNTEYDAAHADRFVSDDYSLDVHDFLPTIEYHAQMATLQKLADWFDYLRENDVYDNTRIILVSDHAKLLRLNEEWMLYTDITTPSDHENGDWDTMAFMPLLMVKDFNAQGFTTSDEFMTNADTSSLAFSGVINEAKNPATGKMITTDAKGNSKQEVLITEDTQASSVVNRTTFSDDSIWITFQGDNVKDADNWKVEGTKD